METVCALPHFGVRECLSVVDGILVRQCVVANDLGPLSRKSR